VLCKRDIQRETRLAIGLVGLAIELVYSFEGYKQCGRRTVTLAAPVGVGAVAAVGQIWYDDVFGPAFLDRVLIALVAGTVAWLIGDFLRRS